MNFFELFLVITVSILFWLWIVYATVKVATIAYYRNKPPTVVDVNFITKDKK